jgi:hypothetical protein
LQSKARTASRESLWEAFPSIEYLLFHIIDKKRKVSINFSILEENQNDETISADHRYIRICLNNCHGKLNYYCRLLDEILIYAAATVFNSSRR